MNNSKPTIMARFKLTPAVYLLLRRRDAILLPKRANTGYQDGKYSLIAGHLNGDELAIDALAREAKEEAGITICNKDFKFVHVAHRLNRELVGQERVDLFFEAYIWQGEIKNMEPDKCHYLSWYPIASLPGDLSPFIKLVLKDVAMGVCYSEYIEEPI